MARKANTVIPQPYKLHLLCIFIIAISRKTSAATVCDVVEKKYAAEIQELLDQVLTYDKLNLIILLDVSASIGYDLYSREVETFAVELVEYGIRTSGMVVHPEHAHIELVTFDDLARIQENTSLPLHACEIYDRLQQLRPGQFNGRTEVHVAFNTTRELFKIRQRPGDKKVLFLVTDAGFTSPPAAVRTSVGQLRTLGVEIFTIGVGRMSSSWIRDNLDRLVLDELHFMCYSSWSEMMKWARNIQVSEVTWAAVTAFQKSDSCPACIAHSSCKCAVNTQTYMCRCDDGRFLSTQSNCEVCPDNCPDGELACTTTCLSNARPTDGGTNVRSFTLSRFTLIIVVMCSILGLLILITVLLLVRWRRYKNVRKSHCNPSSGVHAFFNYIFLGKVINIKTLIVDGHSNTTMKPESNPYVIDTSRPSSTEFSRPSSTEVPCGVEMHVQAFEAMRQDGKHKHTGLPITEHIHSAHTDVTSYVHTACQRHSVASSHVYLSINPASSAVDDEGYETPVSYCIVEPSQESEAYETISNKAHAWINDLDRLVEATDLDGAAVFCKEDDSLATTANFYVRACDVGHMLRLLNTDEQGAVFPINGNMQKIRIHHKGKGLYAEQISGGNDKSATWVINTERHLAIGTGLRAMAPSCEQSIAKFAVALENC